MPEISVNGELIDYPDVGDTNWGDAATDFAIETSAALGKIGLASGTTVDIPSTLDVTGNTTLDANLSVGGTTTLGNTTIAGTLGVTGNTTIDGVIYADDNTTANTPVLSFTGDTNTGIGRSAADTLDFITNGNSRFRIESTGQIKAVYESQVGTDYNTQLDNGYLCRAWVNFNGTGTVAIRASGNVSSIVDVAIGFYTVNFLTAMPDTNYCVTSIGNHNPGVSVYISTFRYGSNLVGSFRIDTFTFSATDTDIEFVNVAVFR